MKIGILTFHFSRNYGAVLQAYGLVEVLKEMGHEVEVLDYRNPSIEYKKHPFSFKHFKTNPIKFLLTFLSSFLNYRGKVKNFSFFGKKYLNITSYQYQPKDIQESDCDVIIVGSDQVWNPVLTNGPDPVYWGVFKPIQARVITYAASSGPIALLETDKFSKINEWLENFDSISVREARLKVFLENHVNKKIEVVVDPTLLAGRKVFERITLPRTIKKPYILVYSVEGSTHITSIVKKVASLYRADIIRLGSNGASTMYHDFKNRITYKNASIEEMLSLIKYAECVVALSFHGTALSLLFEKDFYSIKGSNMARVESILKRCNLMDRIIGSSDEILLSHIDYSVVKPILNNLSEESRNWLRNALSDEHK